MKKTLEREDIDLIRYNRLTDNHIFKVSSFDFLPICVRTHQRLPVKMPIGNRHQNKKGQQNNITQQKPFHIHSSMSNV